MKSLDRIVRDHLENITIKRSLSLPIVTENLRDLFVYEFKDSHEALKIFNKMWYNSWLTTDRITIRGKGWFNLFKELSKKEKITLLINKKKTIFSAVGL